MDRNEGFFEAPDGTRLFWRSVVPEQVRARVVFIHGKHHRYTHFRKKIFGVVQGVSAQAVTEQDAVHVSGHFLYGRGVAFIKAGITLKIEAPMCKLMKQ